MSDEPTPTLADVWDSITGYGARANDEETTVRMDLIYRTAEALREQDARIAVVSACDRCGAPITDDTHDGPDGTLLCGDCCDRCWSGIAAQLADDPTGDHPYIAWAEAAIDGQDPPADTLSPAQRAMAAQYLAGWITYRAADSGDEKLRRAAEAWRRLR